MRHIGKCVMLVRINIFNFKLLKSISIEREVLILSDKNCSLKPTLKILFQFFKYNVKSGMNAINFYLTREKKFVYKFVTLQMHLKINYKILSNVIQFNWPSCGYSHTHKCMYVCMWWRGLNRCIPVVK